MPSATKWLSRYLQRGKEYVERSLGKHGGAHQEAAYESERPASYKTTRAIFLQLLGCTYLIAFASHFVQFEGLYGCDGILPVRQQLDMAQRLHWTLYPTLVRLHSTLGLDAYWVCNCVSMLGMVLSAFALAGYGMAPVMAGCWVCYLSLTTVGDVFMLFQWDSLLLETGFLAILYAPLLQRPSQASVHSSRVAVWMLRFLLFKLTLMSGVVKVASNDRVWQQMTALYYHFASQPLPTPLSWYMRQLHPLALQLGVAFTFVVEIPCAFLILCPLRVVRHWTACILAALQLLIMFTGNYGFFNLLTLALIVNMLDDSCLESLLSLGHDQTGLERGGVGGAWGEQRDEATPLLKAGMRKGGMVQVAGGWGGGVGGRGLVGSGMSGMVNPNSSHGPLSPMSPSTPQYHVMGSVRGGGMGGLGGMGGMSGMGQGMPAYTLDGRPLPMGSLGAGGARTARAGGGYTHIPGGSGMGDGGGGGGGGGGEQRGRGGGAPPLDRGLALHQLFGNSKGVQAAATLMTLVTAVDNSRFWSRLVGRGMLVYIILAVVCMFRVDMDYARHPVAIQVLGAGADWANGRYVATRVWRGSVQYKKKTPLLRLYKTLVGRTSTWVIGAKDEALYYTHSDALDPPVSGWQAASQAAEPPPSLHLVWSQAGRRTLPLLDQAHLKLAIGPEELTSIMSALLPLVMVLFSTGLAVEAGIDISYAAIYGLFTTRRAFSVDPGAARPARVRFRQRLFASAHSWLPLLGALLTSAMSVVILLAHVTCLSEISPSLSTALLETTGGEGLNVGLDSGPVPGALHPGARRLLERRAAALRAGAGRGGAVEEEVNLDSDTASGGLRVAGRRHLLRAEHESVWAGNLTHTSTLDADLGRKDGGAVVLESVGGSKAERSDGYVAGGGGGSLSGMAYTLLEPFLIANGYGLFRDMTGVGPTVLSSLGREVAQVRRPELIVEVSHGVGCDRAGNGGGTSSSSADTPAFDDEDGSSSSDGDADAHALDSGGASEADGDDGLDDSTCEWLPFEFHFKPGNAARAPAWVAPHQPRLDWQMWFGALAYDWQSSRWFPTLVQKLARRSSAVVDLVGSSGVPFEAAAVPSFIRVRKLFYDFTAGFTTEKVLYEAPKGEAEDLDVTCRTRTDKEACENEYQHCTWHATAGRCGHKTSLKHKIVSEQSPDWWTRGEPAMYSPVLGVKEFRSKGYLPAGDSLPNMPITFDGKYVGKREKLGQACEDACKKYDECVAYTLLPSRGICYLKTVASPVRALDCTAECWYYGVVEEHLRATHTYIPLDARQQLLRVVAFFACALLVAHAPIWRGFDTLLGSVSAALVTWPSTASPDVRDRLRAQLSKTGGWLVGLAAVIYGMYYTAHHLGQVFVPYVIAAGTGMMLSCYLFHVETNLEQSPGYEPAWDLSERVSCSNWAESSYSRLFRGVQNSLVGILYYVVLVGLALAFELSPDSYWLLLLTSALGVCGLAVSIYLLHLSCNVLCVICPVCLALHLINFALLWLSLYITHMQRAFLEYDHAFLQAMDTAGKSTYGD